MLSLFSNCAWQYRWRAVLHEAQLLNSQSSYEEDLLWTTTVLYLGLEGLRMWLPPSICEEKVSRQLLKRCLLRLGRSSFAARALQQR